MAGDTGVIRELIFLGIHIVYHHLIFLRNRLIFTLIKKDVRLYVLLRPYFLNMGKFVEVVAVRNYEKACRFAFKVSKSGMKMF